MFFGLPEPRADDVGKPLELLDVNRENTERSKSGRAARISFTLKRADFARLVRARPRPPHSANALFC